MDGSPQMGESQLASLTAEFLKRIDLKGAEVPAFAAVMQWLDGKRTQQNMPDLPEQPADNPEPHEPS